MKKKIINISLLISLFVGILSSCNDEVDLPTLRPVIYSQDFETITTGSGSNEVPINLANWINVNTTSSRVWSGKTFNNDKFAEFSSFYSASGSTDNAWLISGALDLSSDSNKFLSFNSVNRFYNGGVLKVFISTNYDGTVSGIPTANWAELIPILPTSSAQNDLQVSSGPIDISSYKGSNVRIAFKYVGSKTSNPTTTFQLDDILIYEN